MLISATTATVAQEQGQATEEISYTYVSLEYERSNIRDGSEGLTLGFSFEVADPIHIFGGWQETDIDISKSIGLKGDRQGYLIGAGIKQDIAKV